LDGDSSWLMRGLPWVLGAALSIVILGLVAAAEMAFACLNRNQLRQLATEQKRRGRIAELLLSNPAHLLSTLMVTRVLASSALIVSVVFLARVYGNGRWLGWWLFGGIAVLLLVQILSRARVINHEERIAVGLAPLVRLLVLILKPVTAILWSISGGAVPKGAAPESVFLSEDGLRFLLHVSDEESVIEQEEKDMIQSIFDFSDTLVREVMVPRIDVTGVTQEAPMLQALEVILKAGHSASLFIVTPSTISRASSTLKISSSICAMAGRTRRLRKSCGPRTSSRSRRRWMSCCRSCSSAGSIWP